MPKYEFKDLYVPSFDTSGSEANTDPLPTTPILTIDYTEIKPTYLHDEFVFIDGDNVDEAPDRDFDWIEIKRPPQPPSDPLPVWDQEGADESAALFLDDLFLL